MVSLVVPTETPETAHIWAGYRRHEIVLQECRMCGQLRFLPAYHCPSCGSPDWAPRPAAGSGTVFSYVITRRPEGLPVVSEFPVIVLVALDEGVRLVSNLTGIAAHEVRIGLRVRAYFDEAAPDQAIVRFRPEYPETPATAEVSPTSEAAAS